MLAADHELSSRQQIGAIAAAADLNTLCRQVLALIEKHHAPTLTNLQMAQRKVLVGVVNIRVLACLATGYVHRTRRVRRAL